MTETLRLIIQEKLDIILNGLQGIIYYATHQALWQPLASKLLPTLGLGLSVFTGMFFFTYLPQAAVLAIFNGPLAAVSAALLVLSESSTIFNVMARALLVEDSLIDTFDGVSILECVHISGAILMKMLS